MGVLNYKFDCILNEDAENYISEFLSPASPNTSSWYNSLPFYFNSKAKSFYSHWKYFTSGMKNGTIAHEQFTKEFFSVEKNNRESVTGKKCPGIIGNLRNSFLIKHPVDIFIEVVNGNIQSYHISDSSVAEVTIHNDGQFKLLDSKNSKDNIFRNKKSFKITFPILLDSGKIPYIFLNPTFHIENPDLEVINGVIEYPYSKVQYLTIHCFIDTSIDRDIKIKSGDILGYIWFPEKMKLKYNKNLKDHRIKRFANKPNSSFKL